MLTDPYRRYWAQGCVTGGIRHVSSKVPQGTAMLGAIAGDIIGSVYEGSGAPLDWETFPLFQDASRFTDDTVLTAAVAHAILEDLDYADTIRSFARRHPRAGYGASFRQWMYIPDAPPYNSWGNGSAMRVSPVAYACDSVEAVLDAAERTAMVTHDHPEGIKGAQATALAVYLARSGETKESIKTQIVSRFAYDLHRTVANIRPHYRPDVSCQGSVPESIIAFLDSNGVEDAIRLAISLGGDTDTMACIAGAIAEAFYGEVPGHIEDGARSRMTPDIESVYDAFQKRFRS